MWGDRKRLLVLAGLAVVLAGVCVYLYAFGDRARTPDPADLMALLKKDAVDANKANPATGTGGDPSRVGPGANPYPKTPSPSGRASRPRETDELVLRKVVDVARRPKPEHLPALKLAARNRDPAIREVATFGLGRLGKDSDPAFLMQVLKSDSEPAVLVAAATALGGLKCWEAGELLIKLLEHPDSRVSSRAAAALNRIIGVDWGIQPGAPDRQQRIQRLRAEWPTLYQKRQERKSIRG
ncbi:MAG TPA: HEAT repeat domain-containing protein [Phycisphaerae bacterium]|nr:HEAT repeat domain-containing protein [Phycisphaerae bacterium]